jgi:hypothetical protein
MKLFTSFLFKLFHNVIMQKCYQFYKSSQSENNSSIVFQNKQNYKLEVLQLFFFNF